MDKNEERFVHLKKNLERISSEDSIFNYESGQRALLSLGQGNVREWLETLLPNTRLILEPKINGSYIGIQYINGKLKKAINKNSEDITEKIKSLSTVPNELVIKDRLEIVGVIYDERNTSKKSKKNEFLGLINTKTKKIDPKFCAFQILHCKINQFQILKELKKLDFKVPQSQFTNYISDIEIYLQCWREGKLFQNYPTSGIVIKVNSRKLQKYFGHNNLSILWAYAIN